MRFRTLEIRWHDSKPISTCDFQPMPFKKARPNEKSAYAGQAYRLATGGEDNHVRLWMVYPNLLPPSVVSENASSGDPITPRPPRVEYAATLSKHTAAVNVVRFSPNGELIASAGDDGMILIWAPTTSLQAAAFGSELTTEEQQYEKEYWKPRTIVRCTQMQVYDLAWSPSGEYIIAGSTDNAARVFTASDGKCVHEIAEHSHYVQGVAWDPLNEFIATQSSDRSMHIYQISTKNGGFEAHAVGKNSRIAHQHSRTPSNHNTTPRRPRTLRSHSITSDAESVVTTTSELLKDELTLPSSQQHNNNNGPLTPATSVGSTPSVSMFPPPPMDKPSSRRSSFSGSNAPSPPTQYNRYGRSPSPMPALPAIRTLPSNAAWANVKLYGDESFTNFFRRLTFSPDGGLLLTPAGQFEDPTVIPGSSRTKSSEENTPSRGRKGRPQSTENVNPSSASSVFIYSRANFARPPIAQLPGHKKASVAVRFSPILSELRQLSGSDAVVESKVGVLEKGIDGRIDVDVVDLFTREYANASPQKTPLLSPAIIAPAPSFDIMPSPALSPLDSLKPPTPAQSKPSTPAPPAQPTPVASASVFALPYRMLFAVVTMDTVAIYDTQQVGPVAVLTKLHYDEFTDMTWSPDGQCLLLSSRDGYCTLVMFDEIIPAHHTQQHTLQLQNIAQHHSIPISLPSSSSAPLPSSTSVTPAATPLAGYSSLPVLSTPVPGLSKKRSEPSSATGSGGESDAGAKEKRTSDEGPAARVGGDAAKVDVPEPPKKKRRVELTRVGDIGS